MTSPDPAEARSIPDRSKSREQLRAEGKIATLAEVFEAERQEWSDLEAERDRLRDRVESEEVVSELEDLRAENERQHEAVGDAIQVILDALAALQPKQARELMESSPYKAFSAHVKTRRPADETDVAAVDSWCEHCDRKRTMPELDHCGGCGRNRFVFRRPEVSDGV